MISNTKENAMTDDEDNEADNNDSSHQERELIENNPISCGGNEELQGDDSVKNKHTNSRPSGGGGGEEDSIITGTGSRWWNRFFFGNTCNIVSTTDDVSSATTEDDTQVVCGPTTDKAIIEESLNWCGSSGETTAFDAAVQVLLRRTDTTQQHQQQPLWKPDNDYSSIPHCEQLERWDCGIACILMVLRWLRDDQTYPNDSTLTTEEMEERGKLLTVLQTESVWTADLVLLIDQLLKLLPPKTSRQQGEKGKEEEEEEERPQQQQQLQPQHNYLFCSKTFEVDTGYGDFSYYKAAFTQDQIRVTEKFQELKRQRSSILCLSHLSLDAVLNVVVHQNCIAIVLVDNTTLFDTSSSLSSSYNNNRRQGGGGGMFGMFDQNHQSQKKTFAGHYLILCGISTNPNDVQIAQSYDHDTAVVMKAGWNGRNDEAYCLVLVDPGPSQQSKVLVTPQRFERAWRAEGTDDDIIFIAKHHSEQGP